MAVIYLRHPRHGDKVACGEAEAVHDEVHGWQRVTETGDPIIPSFLIPPDGESTPKGRGRRPAAQ